MKVGDLIALLTRLGHPNAEVVLMDHDSPAAGYLEIESVSVANGRVEYSNLGDGSPLKPVPHYLPIVVIR